MMTVNEALKLRNKEEGGVALWYNSDSARGLNLLYCGKLMDKMPNDYDKLKFLSFIPQSFVESMFHSDSDFIHIRVEYSEEKKEPDYKKLWENLYEFVEEQAMMGVKTSYYTIWAFMDRAVSENVDEDNESYSIETVLRAVRKLGKEYETDNTAEAVSVLLVTLGDLSRRGYETILRANEKWYVIGGDKENVINFSGCIILNWLWSRNRLEEKE